MLKLINKILGSVFFTLAFLLLFLFIFGNSLFDNINILETNLEAQIKNSDFVLNQFSEQSGLAKADIEDFCNQNPTNEDCLVLQNPKKSLESMGLTDLKTKFQPYQNYVSMLVTPIFVLFILSLVFYFLGMLSVYGALFKISLNAFFSAGLGYILFSSAPASFPEIINKVIATQSSEIPPELKTILINSLKDWFAASLSALNSFFIGLIAVSLTTSILFYFLKKK